MPGVGEAARYRGSGHFFQIGVGHDDEGAVGAQLHGDLFDAGVAANAVAHLHAAGKSYLPYPRVTGQGVADLAAGAGYGLDGLRGQPSLQ